METGKLYSAICASMLVLGSLPAIAQDNNSENQKSLTLEEIVVTAQRVEQNLQDVPVSVTAVAGSELQERNINELTQLTLAAPTLQVGQDNTFAVRGIGSQIFAQTVDPSVALAIDGVSLGRNGLANVPFNDISSVEVLNGPQGLLFGKNASAGLVNISTKRPELGELSGSFGGEYVTRNSTPADANGHVLKGVLNLPAGENSAFRLSGLFSDQDSIIQNIFPNTERNDLDQERWGLKAKFLHENGPLSLYVIADANESNGTGGRYGRTFRSVDPDSDLVAVFAADGIVPGPENLTNSSDGLMFSDEETGGVQATIEYELDNGMQFINIAGWRYFELDQNLANDFHSNQDIVDNVNKYDYSQFSNELRLVMPQNDSYSGQVGLYYFTSTNDVVDTLDVQGPPPFVAVGFPFCVGAEVTAGPPPNCSVSNDAFLGSDSYTTLKTDSYAVFGQFDFFLTDRFTATLGARITKDDVSSEVTQSFRDYFVNIGGPRGNFSESVDNTNVSWKVGGKYDLTDSSMVYASLGTGYKAPGFNTDFLNLDEVPFAVQDEVSTTLEIGYKSKQWDDRMVFNISAFRTEFEDYQAQSFDLIAQGFIIQNAASVTSQGVEVSMSALLSESFTLYWDVALLDSTFDEFSAASCTPDNVAAQCATGRFFDAAGLPTPLASDITSTIQGVYETQLTDNVEGFIQASMYYRSDLNFGVGSPTLNLENVSIYNFSAGINTGNGLRFSVFCKNCTDERVPTGMAFDAGENNDGLATVNQTWGLDSVRTIGIDITKEF